MRKFIFVLATSFTLAGSLTVHAAALPNLVGQYAFDWLQPTKSKCTALTQKVQDSLKSCEYSDAKKTDSFAGKGDFYKCKASENNEYMIYKTKARCAEEYSVMESNAP